MSHNSASPGRAGSLDATPRAYLGTIELPGDVLADLDSKPAKTRELVDKYLGRRR